MSFHPAPNDPFLEFMRPPHDETPAQRTARIQREHEAQLISDEIDEDIRRQRVRLKKEKNVIKILLLGQAESGKSTTLKNFRMKWAPETWARERNGWRVIVQFNVVRALVAILRAFEADMNGNYATDDGDIMPELLDSPLPYTEAHQLLLIRLAPLRGLETDLKRRLGAGAPEQPPYVNSPMSPTPFETPVLIPYARRVVEFSVRTWEDIVAPNGHSHVPDGGVDYITETLVSCKDDMIALWTDPLAQQVVRRRRVSLPDSHQYFLDALDRIASLNYVVTDNDIVRARLRTTGVTSHSIVFRQSPDNPQKVWEWRIYDVGGCRTQRAAWMSFFENTHVILFLCPMNVFDERLHEDPRVNRLEDSLILWQSICSSKLLAKTQLIMFLNKTDLLKRKLKKGIRVSDYLPSYGTRPNEVNHVSKYFKEKCKEILHTYSPEPRTHYMYFTTVTDTTATSKTLESIRDGVLRENLTTSQLI
ncbi:G-alpha-domain-containing protein [Fistulina hepatica ATCC 64428]|uniref:G-alpha-domain-containing protein n=1 Tax=Fistulina hepatica ATCC 64428 TaxID=1128425 RepID=A0A0D7AEH3_9AGAR|nr:G-alpha-domain-containing protein [Fistulina hepatica ATCC 64428]